MDSANNNNSSSREPVTGLKPSPSAPSIEIAPIFDSVKPGPIARALEVFPGIFAPPKGAKSRSLTEAEMQAEVMKPADVEALGERLRTEDPPMSLDQVRARRASIKEERKRSIDFIRSRTSSRAAALGLPDPNAGLTQGRARSVSSAASGSSIGSSGSGGFASALDKLEEDHKN
ncbi:hypothetical protein BDZ45DRAFT_694892 [Acephala macrosclerotiorum]|nr:hypothetical protein BDZ45DRAFT_694892 [Acephala macrosclerotiorum]